MGVFGGWAVGGTGVGALAAVAILLGLPAGLWSLRRTRCLPAACNALVAWLAAAVPAVALKSSSHGPPTTVHVHAVTMPP